MSLLDMLKRKKSRGLEQIWKWPLLDVYLVTNLRTSSLFD